MSWDPIYNSIVLYKLTAAVVILSMACLTNIVPILLKLMILIVKYISTQCKILQGY